MLVCTLVFLKLLVVIMKYVGILKTMHVSTFHDCFANA